MRVPDLAVWILVGLAATEACSYSASSPTGTGGGSSTGACANCPSSGSGGTYPLELVSAKVVSGTELSLVFSEAVNPPDSVDPTAFRLSVAQPVRAGSTYFQRYDYSAPAHFGHYATSSCLPAASATSCPIDYCWCDSDPKHADSDRTFYYELAPFADLRRGSSSDEIIATLARPLGAKTSGNFVVPPFGENGPCGALYLHYTEPSTGVEDVDGHPLRSIAPTWAEDKMAATATVGGVLVEKPLRVGTHVLADYCAGNRCGDGLRDGDEADVDCGGTCTVCTPGRTCQNGRFDCDSGVCSDGICQAPTCVDAARNQGEADVDCGGSTSCPRCADGKVCTSAADCASGVCAIVSFLDRYPFSPCMDTTCPLTECAEPACNDTLRDGSELDIDCGGSCPSCLGAACGQDTDCASGLCASSVCTSPVVAGISAGGEHGCALTTGGGIKCWGANSWGEVGDGTTQPRLTPVDVSALGSSVVAVSAGGTYYGAFTCALTGAGGVKCWGFNADGELGDGTTTQRSAPVDVVGLTSGVTAISVGITHACALTSTGGVKCWGKNDQGQVGDGSPTTRSSPVDVVGLSSGVVAISAGSDHTCAITSAGGVRCWGSNSDGQLGDATKVTRTTPVDVSGLSSGAVAVSSGAWHTCVVTSTGGALCWGYDVDGELGDGRQTPSRTRPVAVVGLSSGVRSVSAGLGYSCATMISGAIRCWGNNNDGELGDGTTTSSLTPVTVVGFAAGASSVSCSHGWQTTCAVANDGRALCWGGNTFAPIGDGTTTTRTTPTEVYGL